VETYETSQSRKRQKTQNKVCSMKQKLKKPAFSYSDVAAKHAAKSATFAG